MALRSIYALNPEASNLDEALASAADAVLVSVAHSAASLGTARERAIATITTIVEVGKLAFARVNHPRSQLLRDDLDALVSARLAGVMLVHTNEPQDVRDTAVLLREFELQREIEPGAIAVYPEIATARGLMRAHEIVEAAPRTGGLVFNALGYADDIGARLEERGYRFSYARGAVVAAARSVDRLPLCVSDGYDLREMGHYGFAGAIVPDARGVPLANGAFAPTEFEIRRANEHIAAYEAARANGEWIARLGDEIVDASSVRRARQLLG